MTGAGMGGFAPEDQRSRISDSEVQGAEGRGALLSEKNS